LATASAQVCVPLGHSSLYLKLCLHAIQIADLHNTVQCCYISTRQ